MRRRRRAGQTSPRRVCFCVALLTESIDHVCLLSRWVCLCVCLFEKIQKETGRDSRKGRPPPVFRRTPVKRKYPRRGRRGRTPAAGAARSNVLPGKYAERSARGKQGPGPCNARPSAAACVLFFAPSRPLCRGRGPTRWSFVVILCVCVCVCVHVHVRACVGRKGGTPGPLIVLFSFGARSFVSLDGAQRKRLSLSRAQRKRLSLSHERCIMDRKHGTELPLQCVCARACVLEVCFAFCGPPFPDAKCVVVVGGMETALHAKRGRPAGGGRGD